MALEAVVFPPDFFVSAMRELFSFGEGNSTWNYDFGREESEWDISLPILPSSSTTSMTENGVGGVVQEEKIETATATATATATVAGRKKRRRTRSCKNKEEMENQRMTHIAMERNRRKLMNEYLAVLRSIMPPSYVQRGDQASIVGGAINYVKELEQLLQSLESQQKSKLESQPSTSPFFTFPHYSSPSSQCANLTTIATANNIANETMAKNKSSVADIEVTMVERHVSLKVLTSQRPKQLLSMVVGLQNLRLTTLHLNVNSVDHMVLYSFSLKVEDDCRSTLVDEIVTAVHHMVGQIQDEVGLMI